VTWDISSAFLSWACPSAMLFRISDSSSPFSSPFLAWLSDYSAFANQMGARTLSWFLYAAGQIKKTDINIAKL
jgi:hypothetical protein